MQLTKDGVFDNSGGNERHRLRTDRYPVPTCKVFVRKCCVVLGCVSCVLSVRNRCFLIALRKRESFVQLHMVEVALEGASRPLQGKSMLI